MNILRTCNLPNPNPCWSTPSSPRSLINPPTREVTLDTEDGGLGIRDITLDTDKDERVEEMLEIVSLANGAPDGPADLGLV